MHILYIFSTPSALQPALSGHGYGISYTNKSF